MLTIEGNIITKNKTFRGRIEIDESGTISKIGSPKGEADFVFKDELIFPGFVDLHVHARECADHSQDYKEDFASAGQAAINGGVVAFAEMPNNPVPPIDDQSYEVKKGLSKDSPVTVVLYAGIGPGTRPLSSDHSRAGEAKEVPYKAFMGPSVGDLFFTSLEDLEKTLERYGGEHVSFHCEDPLVLEEHKNASTHSGRRPDKAEIQAVDFALSLIKKYGLKGKICHASTLEAIEKILEAKKEGLEVVVEVTPTHLFFDASMVVGKEKLLQMNPPIRQDKKNRLALIEHLKRGDIDYLVTDHAPHTLEEKIKGTSGIPHLDTYGPFVTWLMQEHGFSPQDVLRVSSENPGNFINKFQNEKFGKIEEGYAGSLTVLDPDRKIEIKRENLKTKCGWSPFEGFVFPGSVVMTVVKGEVFPPSAFGASPYGRGRKGGGI